MRSCYSQISDADLDATISTISAQFPCGNRPLIAQGVRVQQHRVREAQRRVDPGGAMLRRLSTINRRSYHVNGPLWHIDGNHKLIRYVSVIS